MELISMTDFVLEQKGDNLKYAQFLKQPLNLGMFVPCVDNEVFNYSKHGNENEYQQAKERVLFEGYKVSYNAVISLCGGYLDESKLKGKTIESLVGTNLVLTKSAQKQL